MPAGLRLRAVPPIARPRPLVQPDGGGLARRLARRLPAAGGAGAKVAASAPKRPPTSMPMTTRRQRRARVSSGYMSHLLRRSALFAAHPSYVSARGCGPPDRITGETMVASRATVTRATRASHWRRPQCAVHRQQGHQCSCQPHGRSARPVLRPRGGPWQLPAEAAALERRARCGAGGAPSVSRRPKRGASGSGSRRRQRRSTRNREGPCRMGSGVKAAAHGTLFWRHFVS